MKKFTVIICLLVSIVASAQYTGPGFYRVHNVYSDSYISIKGTAFQWTSRPDAFWSCIKMAPVQDQDYLSDAGSLIYIPYLEQTSLYAQGVDTYSLTGLLMDVMNAKEQEGGMETYVAQTKTWITMGGEDVLFPFLFRDQGTGLTVGSSENAQSRWWIEPVNEESMETSYFGVQPTSDAVKDEDGWYWTTLCCDFPLMIPTGGGVEGAYTVKDVILEMDGAYYANPEKVYGQGEVVPAATPVLLKCQNAEASGNKLIPTGEIANNTTLPLKNDLLMGNYFSTFINHSSLTDASVMNLYIPDQASMASEEFLALGVDADGKLGFFPQAEGSYMAANTSWLSIEGLDLDGVTAVYIHEIARGDANGDGEITVKDVTMLIDYLLTDGDLFTKDGNSITMAGADLNGDGMLTIKDVTMLIDLLMTL